jgi:hypothetical protein
MLGPGSGTTAPLIIPPPIPPPIIGAPGFQISIWNEDSSASFVDNGVEIVLLFFDLMEDQIGVAKRRQIAAEELNGLVHGYLLLARIWVVSFYRAPSQIIINVVLLSNRIEWNES